MASLRESTLSTMGLPSALSFFKAGRRPVAVEDLVEEVFGPESDRGSLVISGANGIVGAGKAMQLGSRLAPYGVTVVGLDFPGAPDGIGRQYPGLVRAFGPAGAAEIASNIVRLAYDGKRLPRTLADLSPKLLVEAIPEILEVKRAHYRVFREAFPGIEIRSVTSGFPARELGVGIAHPAFPHEINKVWEIVEDEPSAVTKLLWALGLVPMPMGDHWSFVLDVLFCGLTLAAGRACRATNVPYWKADKFIRRDLGPNPFRAHDAIGAAGANFLTWSCLDHLSKQYGGLFTPNPELAERKDTGENWYPPNHFRPVVDWKLTPAEEERFSAWVMGPLLQMTALVVDENRAHFAFMNAIGEICAQFRSGVLALVRKMGPEEAIRIVEGYHRLDPAAKQSWRPQAFERLGEPEWRQLYVNAEHDGTVGVVAIGRESLNADVDDELNRAIDWLKAEGVSRVILTGDFHLATQLVGADTSEFHPALDSVEAGAALSTAWTKTARRFADEFETSVGFVAGKRALGGMLELLAHCHYLVAPDDAQLGFPEVTLPVVPGMEGCHWPFRKAKREDWPKLLKMLLTGAPVKGRDAVGWLVDAAGTEEQALAAAWAFASGGDAPAARRPLKTEALKDLPEAPADLPPAGGAAVRAGREAILGTIRASLAVPLAEALAVQARRSAEFMTTDACRRGAVGTDKQKLRDV